MSEKYVVTWDMFHMHARKLSERLLPASQWKGIVAVSRGGLFPAAVLARELGIRHVETVCIASYNHDKQGELQVLHAAQLDNGGEGFIVIDDLVDTGNTARAIREMYPNARFVTVFAKQKHVRWGRMPWLVSRSNINRWAVIRVCLSWLPQAQRLWPNRGNFAKKYRN